MYFYIQNKCCVYITMEFMQNTMYANLGISLGVLVISLA
jgi:hypothetical protein